MSENDVIYSGKTKDIYALANGHLKLVFKDDVTGENGVVDPGANSVMGQIQGKGRMSLEMTQYFFEKFHAAHIPTHLVSVDVAQGAMEVKRADPPGKAISETGGLEFICRPLAYGSFLRRYGKYVKAPLQPLDYLVEVTLKDDERGDPLINDDALVILGLLTRAQLEQGKEMTRQIATIVERDLRDKGLTLVDMKIEVGLIGGEVVLIDEVSADAMRVMDANGKQLDHQTLYSLLIG